MELSQATAFVEGCIHDAPAPCSCACPFKLDVRSFLKKVAKGRLSAAYRELRTATVFPTVAACLCPGPCRARCQRAVLGDEAVDLGRLEQAVVRLAGPQPPDVFQVPPKGEKVAVVGAGPAGLSVALNMAQKKYPVTVFEASDDLGGSLRAHPDFALFRQDILTQFSQEQVDFRFDHAITSMEELGEFTAVYLATGEGGADFGLRDGWDRALYTTGRSLVFMGGGLCAMPLMESIAAGAEVSRLMEGAIQTGRAAGKSPDPVCHAHVLVPADARPAPLVTPADPGEGYTKAEAREEAGRCFQCTCDRCLKGCELLGKYGKAPQQMAMEVLGDSSPHFLASRAITREVYSCNLCGWCGDACPEGVDLGALFQFSRTARAADGIQPAALHDFWLRELEFVSTEAFYAAAPRGRETCEYAFFPGCQLTASLPDQTLAAQKWLTGRYGAGTVLGCCGASAWWAGEQALWEENSARLRAAWEGLGRPTFVLACATCADLLDRLIPEIQTVSLYELLAQQEDLPVEAVFPAAAVFDPCSARRDDQMRRGVRKLAARSGCALEELEDQGRCCGWGGHMRTANPGLYDLVAQRRAGQSELPYLVYCANCREVFQEKGKPCRHILEAVFGAGDEVWSLHQKRENRLQVKGRLMEDMEGKKLVPTRRDWDDLVLSIDGAVRREMEEQLISDEEVKECVWRSLQSGERFGDGADRYLASLQKRVMTYWVEYTQDGEAYRILSAYSHRMKLGGEGQE